MADHPNFLDRMAVKIYSNYLYPGQTCQTVATLHVGIIHKSPDTTASWKIMDYLYLKSGSFMKYLGLARNLKINGEVQPLYTILELLRPEVEENKSPGKHASPRDLVCITPYDRQFVAAASSDPGILGKLTDVIAPFPTASPHTL